ncbi:alkaline phosphatase family protein [Thermicanus aegyptius]|uniref:alkaline phosphatase family protein n=1 Tax=Thermicanus aegyptius TaxID=94009 RepID=UPI000491FE73|nr:alkaline phosphatase family protein [Thermicanus aegyptius]
MEKKVILLLIDSLMWETVEKGISDGSTPAIKFLVERGRVWKDTVTVFPTMTASVDSSLLTGVYPDRHKVPGLIWYDPITKGMVNYVNGWKSVLKIGVVKTAHSLLHDLNEKHLSREVSTLFEELSRRDISSAAINAVVHRGPVEHRLRVPFLLRLITGTTLEKPIFGPEWITLGALLPTEVNRKVSWWVRGPFKRYGINDAYAVEALLHHLSLPSPPRFFFVYLSDHDHQVHKSTPIHALPSLRKVDEKITRILDFFPSWEEAIRQAVFLVVGDHGQTPIGREKRHHIDLDRLLSSFSTLPLGKRVKNEELVYANNERMVFLYPLKEGILERLISHLGREEKIDLIAWKEKGGVALRQRGGGERIRFWPEGAWKDPYGREWGIDGEMPKEVALVKGEHILFDEYPDLFSRLYGALYCQEIPMVVVTAAPGYEFKSRFYPSHLGGSSHGSLHRFDSYVPLIITGADLPYPTPPRLIDVKEYILRLLSPSS